MRVLNPTATKKQKTIKRSVGGGCVGGKTIAVPRIAHKKLGINKTKGKNKTMYRTLPNCPIILLLYCIALYLVWYYLNSSLLQPPKHRKNCVWSQRPRAWTARLPWWRLYCEETRKLHFHQYKKRISPFVLGRRMCYYWNTYGTCRWRAPRADIAFLHGRSVIRISAQTNVSCKHILSCLCSWESFPA